nr:MAG TPA: Sporulation protein Cse60 [Caudoviricetes sp.]
MIKTKIFEEEFSSELEWDVNNFFKRNPDAELVDVKFQTAITDTENGLEERYAAMVIYKETEK